MNNTMGMKPCLFTIDAKISKGNSHEREMGYKIKTTSHSQDNKAKVKIY